LCRTKGRELTKDSLLAGLLRGAYALRDKRDGLGEGVPDDRYGADRRSLGPFRVVLTERLIVSHPEKGRGSNLGAEPKGPDIAGHSRLSGRITAIRLVGEGGWTQKTAQSWEGG